MVLVEIQVQHYRVVLVVLVVDQVVLLVLQLLVGLERLVKVLLEEALMHQLAHILLATVVAVLVQ
jgi:hypothetical protein